MGKGCPEGKFWDVLVKNCMTCQTECLKPHCHARCATYCVSQRCKAVSGQYYDRLLKTCLRCGEVCGSHPSECSQECQTQKPALSVTQNPEDVTALQTPTSRGGSIHRGLPHSAILVHSLLGLCVGLLLCTISVALLVLLRRARARVGRTRPGPTQGSDTQGQKRQEGQEPRQSSKDCLVAPGMPQLNGVKPVRSSSPTETCVHCFPDLRVTVRGEEKQHRAGTPITLYQQAVPQRPLAPTNGAPHCGQERPPQPWTPVLGNGVGVLLPGGPMEKSGGLRVICSPSQHSI